MENLEQYWEQSFSPIGRKFTEIRPDYQDMGETDSMVAALYWLELEMYNGGFLQFFCKKFISCFHYGTLLFDVNGSAGNGLPLSCVVNGIFIFSLYYKKPLKQRETTKGKCII